MDTEDDGRPICPICNVPVQRNGRQNGVQHYRCGRCRLTGTRETLEKNALRHQLRVMAGDDPWYDQMLHQVESDCELCEDAPAGPNGLYHSCSMRIINARRKAARIDADEKRRQAHVAALTMLAQGYVMVRLR